MNPLLPFTLALIIIILAAKAAGYLSYRLRQPTVLGELLVGILLGPTALDILHWPYFADSHLEETIHLMAELGVLLLMFLAGLELHIGDLLHTRKVASLAGILGVVFPFGLGMAAGLAFSMSWEAAVFLGLVLSATSVSISAQTLMEMNVLHSRVGISLLGAAVLDDILVVLGLSVFSALAGEGATGGVLSVGWIVLRMVLFLGVGAALGVYLLPRLVQKADGMPISKGLVAFVFIVILLYSWSAEALGNMAALTGAFLAGVMLSRSALKERIETGIATLAYGLFVPIFFVNVGLAADARQLLGDSLGIFLVLLLVAILGKVFGSGLGASLAGFNRLEALQLGTGMMSRGEVGLIVASVGIAAGWIGDELFATVVGVVVVTTLLTPPMLRALFHRAKSAEAGVTAPSEGD
ncbi:MAG: cation:proton antiporter [Anaerolineales bacterium]|nr:cation:proton antiporter [Anaerolineales bacterium]